MSDTLSPAEIALATGKRRPATQAAVLARRGVPFRFTTARVIVDRAVALAHELLPRESRSLAASGAAWWSRTAPAGC